MDFFIILGLGLKVVQIAPHYTTVSYNLAIYIVFLLLSLFNLSIKKLVGLNFDPLSPQTQLGPSYSRILFMKVLDAVAARLSVEM